MRLSQLIVEDPPAGAVERQYVQSTLEDLTEGLGRVVGDYGAHELTSVVCALSLLGYYDGPLLQQIFEASWRLLPSMSPRIACGMLWSFARYHRDFKLPVDLEWADAMLEHVVMDLELCTPSVLSQALYASALLRHRPSAVWTERVLTYTQQHMGEFSARDVSGSLWSLATLRLDPGRPWLDAALAQAEAETRGFVSGTSVASVLWALAVLGHKPEKSWMEHFLWQVGTHAACDP